MPNLTHARARFVWGNHIFVITAISSDSKTSFQAKDRGIDLANDDARHTWMIFAVDKRNGKVLWTNKAYEGVPRAKRHVKGLASEDGDVFVVKAGRQYELLSRNTRGQPLMATPALSQGMLIVRGENALYALGNN